MVLFLTLKEQKEKEDKKDPTVFSANCDGTNFTSRPLWEHIDK